MVEDSKPIQRRPALVILTSDSPVSLRALEPREEARLIDTHRHGVPLTGLQHDMLEALRRYPRQRMAVYAQFDPSRDPSRFLDQMAEATHYLKTAGETGLLETMARKHNFHPEFAARIAGYRPAGGSGVSDRAGDERIVALQRRQSLPAFQEHMKKLHGETQYVAWLKENGFEIVAAPPERIRAQNELAFQVAAQQQQKQGLRRFVPTFKGSK